MAIVDFSNATITKRDGSDPWSQGNFCLGNATPLRYESNTIICDNFSRQPITRSASKEVWLFSGKFTEAGNRFTLMTNNSGLGYGYGWNIENVSFDTGDTFAFQITIEIIS